MLEEAREKSAKEKRKRKKERDGSRAEEGLSTTAGRPPAGATSQPVTGDKETGRNISSMRVFPVSVSFDLMDVKEAEHQGDVCKRRACLMEG